MHESLPTLNIDLLADLVNWAAADEDNTPEHPEWGKWAQNLWGLEVRNGVCKTAYCIAGQASVQSGFQFAWDRAPIMRTGYGDDIQSHYETPLDLDPGSTYEARSEYLVYPVKEVTVDGKVRKVADTARRGRSANDVAVEALGITDYEAEELFDGDNSIEKIVCLAYALAARRDEVLVLSERAERHHDSDWVEELRAMLDELDPCHA